MGELFGWWLAVELLGIVALPLCAVLLAHLPDRGWALAKPLGLLALGWLVWFPLSIVTALPYSRAWIIGVLIVFALGNVALLRLPDVRAALLRILTRERVHVVLVELVFTGAFALMAWIRSFTPAVVDQEKFMDVAFLSAIWRAPHLPPPDPWLSGEAINYYYFGHFLLATLTKLLGTAPAVAFNIGVALIFALTAVAVFGVATNLLAAIRRSNPIGATDVPQTSSGGRPPQPRLAPVAGLVSVLLVLILGNLNGAQVAWQDAVSLSSGPGATLPNPWAYFIHRELWLDYNWWTPSRVILPSNTINEFPAFSFILSDLHAHVLALPFAALALALALSFVLARGEGLRVYGTRITGPVTLIGAAVVLGALYALNGWDLPTYLGLALLALVIQQWLAHGRQIDGVLLLDLFAASATLVALVILLYLPFYRGFVSPSQGVGLVPGYARAPVGQEFAVFGLPFVIAESYLVWRLAAWLGARLAVAGAEPASMPPRGLISSVVDSPRVLGALAVGLAAAALVLLTLATGGWLGWTLLWTLLIVGACAGLALQLLGARWDFLPRAFAARGEAAGETMSNVAGETCLAPTVAGHSAIGQGDGEEDEFAPTAVRQDPSTPLDALNADVGAQPASPSEIPHVSPPRVGEGPGERSAEAWLLCLLGAAAALVAACELVFLRDIFAGGTNGQLGDLFRMNTVFKLYYQAWLIAGVASGPALVLLARAAWGYLAALVSSLVVSRAVAGASVALAGSHAQTSEGTGAHAESLSAETRESGEIGVARMPSARLVDIKKAEASWVTTASRQGRHRVSALRYASAGGIVVWMALLALLGAAALVYPALASAARTQNFALPRSLDGTAFMANDATDAGDADAITWLNAHIEGDEVIVEAAKYDEYTHLGRVSAFTGLPTLLGWGGHEVQWRINWLSEPGRGDVLGQRLDAVNQIYTNPDDTTVKRLLRQYSVRLIYVGAAERQTYPSANLDRFAAFLPIVYSREGVTIYAAPEGSSS